MLRLCGSIDSSLSLVSPVLLVKNEIFIVDCWACTTLMIMRKKERMQMRMNWRVLGKGWELLHICREIWGLFIS